MENQEKKLLAGYAQVIITPPLGLKMPGQYSIRPAEGITVDLKARAVAFQSGEKKAILLLCDALYCHGNSTEQIREKIAARCEMDPEAIHIACNHSHTATAVFDLNEVEDELEKIYAARQHQILTDLAQFAFEDLHPVTAMKKARGEVKNVAFLRRYRMKDGTCMTNPVGHEEDILHPLGEADESLQMVRILREGAKEIVLLNFGTHADVVGKKKFHADYTDFLCNYFKAALEDQVEVIDFVGCQGDSNHVNWPKTLPGEKFKGEHFAKRMARMIAGEALKIYDDAVDMASDTEITTASTVVKIGQNPHDPADEEEAKTIARLYKELGNKKDPIFKTFKLNVPEANRIVRNLSRPEFFDVPLSAVRIGEFAFAGIPGEPFQKIGLDIKAASPFEMTFVTCCTNGYIGYYPTRDAFEEKGYERSTSPFAWDCAEIVTEGCKEIISKLK